MRCGFSVRMVPVSELVTGDLILDVNGTDTFIRYDASTPARACEGFKPGSSVPVVRRPSTPRGGLLAKVLDRHRSH